MKFPSFCAALPAILVILVIDEENQDFISERGRTEKPSAVDNSATIDKTQRAGGWSEGWVLCFADCLISDAGR